MLDALFLTRRRLMIAGGALFSAAKTLPVWAAADTPPANAISPDEALQRLMDGNGRYAANKPTVHDYSAGRVARSKAQFPIAAILGCADSRVSPEIVFDQALGDLFVVRVAGNTVNVDGIASLEYAVQFLGVPLIMVLGHSGCGAVAAAVKVVKENAKLPGHLPELIDSIKPAVVAAALHPNENLTAAATFENVRQNVNRLATNDVLINRFVTEGKVKVVGGVYEIDSGRVTMV
ncbi:MAG TPA: carbonic anhydrase [Alphaproteobacteria bacterium]|nr:carbonic anhydrase [Alphaproteobacteria bacterium]